MFFVLIKRDTGLGFEKFSHLCVYFSKIDLSDTACAFAHREPKTHNFHESKIEWITQIPGNEFSFFFSMLCKRE